MNMFIALSVAHYFVETELILSKENRQRHILRENNHLIITNLIQFMIKTKTCFLETYMTNPTCLACLLKFLERGNVLT